MTALAFQAILVLAVSDCLQCQCICSAEPSGKRRSCPPCGDRGDPLGYQGLDLARSGCAACGCSVSASPVSLGLASVLVESCLAAGRLPVRAGRLKKTARPYTLRCQQHSASSCVCADLGWLASLGQAFSQCVVRWHSSGVCGQLIDMIAGTASLVPACEAQVC